MNEYEKMTESADDRADLCVEVTAVKVAELIAKQMESRNISRTEFARMMGVTPGRVTQILDADSNLQLRTVAKALAVLGFVMDVEAVSIESYSCPEKWEETVIPTVAPCHTHAVPCRTASARVAGVASEQQYFLAA